MVVVDHIDSNLFSALGEKVAHTLSGPPQRIWGAEDLELARLGSIQITEGLKPKHRTLGHQRQLRGGDFGKSQNAADEPHHWQS